ncbi:tripartite tricarboxylate transporter substrate binding protein [Bordetella petrii]|nr:tripartite tricarboxylate transporter substrate binding protein [Bordetella petrii]
MKQLQSGTMPPIRTRPAWLPGRAHRAFRRMLAVALGALACAAGPAQAADASAFPSKPIRLIVPYAAGGGTDAFARLVGESLAKQAGQPVIVENKPGAAGLVAGAAVANAAPDGYTLLIDQSSIAYQPLLYPNSAFDMRRDLTPIILGATLDNVLLVTPGFPAQTVSEMIELVRGKPDAFDYASTGNGTPQHLAMEVLKRDAGGLQIQHVPYKGGNPGIVATSTGEVDMFFISVSTALPFIESGRVRALASGGKQRSAMLPNLPTFAESGLPGFQATGWLGFFAPAGTPAPIIGRLNALFEQALQDEATRKAAAQQGFEVAAGPPDRFARMLADDLAVYGPMIEQLGLANK